MNEKQFQDKFETCILTRNWSGARALLPQYSMLSEARPVFLDFDMHVLVGTACFHKMEADAQYVVQQLFPPLEDVVHCVDTVGRQCSVTQLEALLVRIWRTFYILSRSWLKRDLQRSELFCWFFENSFMLHAHVDKSMAVLLARLSDATMARLTARIVRMWLVEWAAIIRNDFWKPSQLKADNNLALVQLLERRPDIDVNVLLEDGAPAWYTPGYEVFRFDIEWRARVCVNMPFTQGTVSGPVLQHLVCAYAAKVCGSNTARFCRRLLESGATPLCPAVATSMPCMNVVIAVFEDVVRNEGSAAWFATPHDESNDDGGYVFDAPLCAEVGLQLLPTHVERMTRRLGVDSPGLAAILRPFAEQERWRCREAAVQVLFDGTQDRGHCAHVEAAVSPLLSTVLRDWNSRRAAPVDNSRSFMLSNELAGLVITFLS